MRKIHDPLLSNDEEEEKFDKDSPYKQFPFKYIVFGIIIISIFILGILIGYFSAKSHNKKNPTPAPTPSTFTPEELPDCEVYESPSCAGSSGDMASKWSTHLWNTPARGDTANGWKPGYQDMRVLVGYAQQIYGSDRNTCQVNIITKTHHNLSLSYVFDGVSQTSNSKTYDSSYKGLLKVKVIATTGETLELDEIDFIWNLEPLKERSGDYRNGQKGAIVELFGWPDDDIAEECRFIAR